MSLVVSTQLPLQSVCCDWQELVQLPLLQTWLAAQALPHLPQSSVLLAKLTHWPEQLMVPDGHLQAPPEQNDPPEQTSPQPPQLLLSFSRPRPDCTPAVQ